MEQWKSEQIGELMAAVAKAQAALQPAKKDAANPFFKSKYADLPAVWDALAPFRTEGIALVQCPAEAENGHIAIETTMAHSSGQWIRSRLVMRLAKDDPQGAGSALTYARRYALGCMTGLVTEEDDDGNAASHAPVKPMQNKLTAQAKINELRSEGAAPGTPPPAVSASAEDNVKQDPPTSADAPSSSGEPPEVEVWRAKIRTAHDSKAAQAIYNSVPEEIRQDCFACYSDKLKSFNAKRKA